ncbi:MAG: PHP domain-containing protein [Dehalococcoidia bacterium]|nr:PHP domain-containing protein [Dehalococcoidia bacterium]
MKFDLHLHSTASDGRLSPEELVRSAARLGLAVMSITDHDSIDGIAAALKAAEEYPSLQVIPGVECSTDVPRGEVHVLGYFIDYTNAELASKLASFRNSRKTRALKMIDKLAGMGISIEWKRVAEIAGAGSVGRPHIAQAMLEKGYVPSIREAFNRYIGREAPAYVEREKMTPAEVVELITHARGLPVLAHPADIEDLDHLIPLLQRVGLVGLEVYYNNYPRETIQHLASMAHKHALVATGGSDFHGLDEATETPIGGVAIPPECVERLRALNKRRSR